LRNILLYISYDGTDFSGWELQPGKRTVRGELEKALTHLFKRPISLSTVSRTDAGVHALANIVFFQTKPQTIPVKRLPAALNSVLPGDVRVLKANDEVKGKAKGLKVKSKIYEYLIFNGETCPPLIRRYVWHLKPRLNLAAMKKAAKYLIGKHDFTSFCAAGGAEQDHTKMLFAVNINKKKIKIWGGLEFEVCSLKFQGDGFLYKMVRNLVGTLVDVGLGRIRPEEVEIILKAKDRKRAGRTAPPQGLCLIEII